LFGEEFVDGAGEDAEAGFGPDDAGLLAEVFGVGGGGPDGGELFGLVLELISREGDGEALFLLRLEFGFGREHLANPGGDFADDLADAGLGDAVIASDLAGGDELDLIFAVDGEVAGGGREGVDHGWAFLIAESRCRKRMSKVESGKWKAEGWGRRDPAVSAVWLGRETGPSAA
jgi:hypothetical protein